MHEQIFISYSSLDTDWALNVKKTLEEKGYSCWMANNGGINPGENYAQKIAEALDACSVFLLILSPNAENSPWVPKELNTAISARKHIIPFQIVPSDTVPFAFQLENIQILTLDKMRKKESLEILASAVAQALNKELISIDSPAPSHAHKVSTRGLLTTVLLIAVVVLIILFGIIISFLRKRTDPSPQTNIENPAASNAATTAVKDNSDTDSDIEEAQPDDFSMYDHVSLYSQHMMESDHTEVFDKYTNSVGEVCKNVVCIKFFDQSSYVTYYLGGKYDFFTATLSCPDDIDSGYSYDFQIWLDGNQMEPVYDLNMGRSTSPTLSLSIYPDTNRSPSSWTVYPSILPAS